MFSKTLAVLIGCCSISCLAEPCKVITDRDKQVVSKFVTEKYHIEGATKLDVSQIDNSCFWKFAFTTPHEILSVYLSPDHQFIATQLFDVTIDPALEEKQRAEAAMKALVANDPPTIGSDSAPVTIVEFTDFQCPYCQKLRAVLEQDVLPKEAGKVRIVFRNYPLETHPWAEAASMLAMCANLQDESSFWKLHDFIFDNQKLLTIDNLRSEVLKFMASNTTLEMKAFNKCADKDLSLGMVRKDLQLGEQFGVRSTPTAFVNGVKFEGIQGAAQLIALIESASAGVSLSDVNRTSHTQETAGAPMCPVRSVARSSVRRQLVIQ